MLGDIADLVQMIGLPIAIVIVLLAYRESRKSRDLQAALAFSDAFRASWETSWDSTLQQTEELARRDEQPTGELREQLFSILNWLDWVGSLIGGDVLARPQVVLSSILPQLRRALLIIEPILTDDEARHEPGYWRGVRILQRALTTREIRRAKQLARVRNIPAACRAPRNDGDRHDAGTRDLHTEISLTPAPQTNDDRAT
jgi:hypothetical protein